MNISVPFKRVNWIISHPRTDPLPGHQAPGRFTGSVLLSGPG